MLIYIGRYGCISWSEALIGLVNCRSQVPTGQRLLLKVTYVIFSPKKSIDFWTSFLLYVTLFFITHQTILFNFRNFIQVCWATLNYNFSVSYYKTFTMEIDVFTGNLLLLIQSCILLICKFIYCMYVLCTSVHIW